MTYMWSFLCHADEHLLPSIYRLMEIESRLLPCGLHIVGEPPSAMEAIATLVNIAEIDRPECNPPVKGLPGILARSINRNMEQIYLNNNKVWRLQENLPMLWSQQQ